FIFFPYPTLFRSLHFNMTLLSFIIFLVTLSAPHHQRPGKTYAVKRISSPIQLSGTGDDRLWNQANLLSDFIYPWEKDTPRLTKFRALHDDKWLYCLFEVADTDINIRQKTNDKSEVAASSRA